MYWQATYSDLFPPGGVPVTKLLLSLHVIAAIVVIGPITVAASLFPRYVRQSLLAGGGGGGGPLPAVDVPGGGSDEEGSPAGITAFLYRICSGYAVAGIAVPLLGIATGARMGALTQVWLIVSVVLTAVAAGVLTLAILPRQRYLLAPEPAAAGGAGEGVAVVTDAARLATAARLSMLTGIFNLLWAVVVVLMIVRPGSTTGA